MRGDEQDNLGRLWEVSLCRYPYQHVPHVILQGVECPSRAGTVLIPRLRDGGVRGTELSDKREDTY